MFTKEDWFNGSCIGLFILAVIYVARTGDLDQKSNLPPPMNKVMLIGIRRDRTEAKVQWKYGRPYCSPHKDDSGLGLLKPKGEVDGVSGTRGWEPLTDNMKEFYDSQERGL